MSGVIIKPITLWMCLVYQIVIKAMAMREIHSMLSNSLKCVCVCVHECVCVCVYVSDKLGYAHNV